MGMRMAGRFGARAAGDSRSSLTEAGSLQASSHEALGASATYGSESTKARVDEDGAVATDDSQASANLHQAPKGDCVDPCGSSSGAGDSGASEGAQAANGSPAQGCTRVCRCVKKKLQVEPADTGPPAGSIPADSPPGGPTDAPRDPYDQFTDRGYAPNTIGAIIYLLLSGGRRDWGPPSVVGGRDPRVLGGGPVSGPTSGTPLSSGVPTSYRPSGRGRARGTGPLRAIGVTSTELHQLGVGSGALQSAGWSGGAELQGSLLASSYSSRIQPPLGLQRASEAVQAAGAILQDAMQQGERGNIFSLGAGQDLRTKAGFSEARGRLGAESAQAYARKNRFGFGERRRDPAAELAEEYANAKAQSGRTPVFDVEAALAEGFGGQDKPTAMRGGGLSGARGKFDTGAAQAYARKNRFGFGERRRDPASELAEELAKAKSQGGRTPVFDVEAAKAEGFVEQGVGLSTPGSGMKGIGSGSSLLQRFHAQLAKSAYEGRSGGSVDMPVVYGGKFQSPIATDVIGTSQWPTSQPVPVGSRSSRAQTNGVGETRVPVAPEDSFVGAQLGFPRWSALAPPSSTESVGRGADVVLPEIKLTPGDIPNSAPPGPAGLRSQRSDLAVWPSAAIAGISPEGLHAVRTAFRSAAPPSTALPAQAPAYRSHPLQADLGFALNPSLAHNSIRNGQTSLRLPTLRPPQIALNLPAIRGRSGLYGKATPRALPNGQRGLTLGSRGFGAQGSLARTMLGSRRRGRGSGRISAAASAAANITLLNRELETVREKRRLLDVMDLPKSHSARGFVDDEEAQLLNAIRWAERVYAGQMRSSTLYQRNHSHARELAAEHAKDIVEAHDRALERRKEHLDQKFGWSEARGDLGLSAAVGKDLVRTTREVVRTAPKTGLIGDRARDLARFADDVKRTSKMLEVTLRYGTPSQIAKAAKNHKLAVELLRSGLDTLYIPPAGGALRGPEPLAPPEVPIDPRNPSPPPWWLWPQPPRPAGGAYRAPPPVGPPETPHDPRDPVAPPDTERPGAARSGKADPECGECKTDTDCAEDEKCVCEKSPVADDGSGAGADPGSTAAEDPDAPPPFPAPPAGRKGDPSRATGTSEPSLSPPDTPLGTTEPSGQVPGTLPDSGGQFTTASSPAGGPRKSKAITAFELDWEPETAVDPARLHPFDSIEGLQSRMTGYLGILIGRQNTRIMQIGELLARDEPWEGWEGPKDREDALAFAAQKLAIETMRIVERLRFDDRSVSDGEARAIISTFIPVVAKKFERPLSPEETVAWATAVQKLVQAATLQRHAAFRPADAKRFDPEAGDAEPDGPNREYWLNRWNLASNIVRQAEIDAEAANLLYHQRRVEWLQQQGVGGLPVGQELREIGRSAERVQQLASASSPQAVFNYAGDTYRPPALIRGLNWVGEKVSTGITEVMRVPLGVAGSITYLGLGHSPLEGYALARGRVIRDIYKENPELGSLIDFMSGEVSVAIITLGAGRVLRAVGSAAKSASSGASRVSRVVTRQGASLAERSLFSRGPALGKQFLARVATGGAFGGGIRVLENIDDDRPLMEGVLTAIVEAAALSGIVPPIWRRLPRSIRTIAALGTGGAGAATGFSRLTEGKIASGSAHLLGGIFSILFGTQEWKGVMSKGWRDDPRKYFDLPVRQWPLYEFGQVALPDHLWMRYQNLSEVQRGRALLEDPGFFKTLLELRNVSKATWEAVLSKGASPGSRLFQEMLLSGEASSWLDGR